ncbi:helix-turn-helix domain-containing protein [Dactylosporangium sp. AC04546]|uniref:helix-turn-helix domain-containing protein n=1 Tax=Dactylosporangium sp. AC04546 TaxID=2862460 RepID=UPI003FA4295C
MTAQRPAAAATAYRYPRRTATDQTPTTSSADRSVRPMATTTTRVAQFRPTWSTPAAHDRMCQLYAEQGLSIRTIASRMDCSYGTVYGILRAKQVPMRPPGRHPHASQPRTISQAPRVGLSADTAARPVAPQDGRRRD